MRRTHPKRACRSRDSWLSAYRRDELEPTSARRAPAGPRNWKAVPTLAAALIDSWNRATQHGHTERRPQTQRGKRRAVLAHSSADKIDSERARAHSAYDPPAYSAWRAAAASRAASRSDQGGTGLPIANRQHGTAQPSHAQASRVGAASIQGECVCMSAREHRPASSVHARVRPAGWRCMARHIRPRARVP